MEGVRALDGARFSDRSPREMNCNCFFDRTGVLIECERHVVINDKKGDNPPLPPTWGANSEETKKCHCQSGHVIRTRER